MMSTCAPKFTITNRMPSAITRIERTQPDSHSNAIQYSTPPSQAVDLPFVASCLRVRPSVPASPPRLLLPHELTFETDNWTNPNLQLDEQKLAIGR